MSCNLEYLSNIEGICNEFYTDTKPSKQKPVQISETVQELLNNRYYMALSNDEKERTFSQLCKRVSRVVAATETVHYNDVISFDENATNTEEADERLLNHIRKLEKSIYNDMIQGNFLFNSPCLFSAGAGFSSSKNGHLLYDDEITLDDYKLIAKNRFNKNQMLFACFVIGIDDTIEGIFESVKECAIISKSGGGVGLNFSPIREKNAIIKGNGGLASGVVPFAGDFNAMGDSIRQGGKRRVALMGMLNSNHPDIEEFINCKTEEGKLSNFNISVAIDDKFMEAVANDDDYELKSVVDGKVVRTVKARQLWDTICESAWKRGDPGIFFIDSSNKDNFLKYDEEYYIRSTNPCGEVPLPDYTSCNLGSINLVNFVNVDGEFDEVEFRKMVKRGVYYLDLVIDTSSYPLKRIEKRTKDIRPIGLGIMGLADAFIKMSIIYGSEESVELSSAIADIMAGESLYESVWLGRIKGSFPKLSDIPQQEFLTMLERELTENGIVTGNTVDALYAIITDNENIKTDVPISLANALYSLYMYSGTNHDEYHMTLSGLLSGYLRNSRRLSIAPTGSIAMILNTSSSLEPNFAFEWKRNIISSNGEIETKIFKHKYADIEHKELLVTANELSTEGHISIVKAFAPCIDSAISKCVAKGTEIYTNRGIMKIENFGNPDKEIDTFEDISDKDIYVRDATNNWRKVLSHYRGGNKRTYKITLYDGFMVECSATHKFLAHIKDTMPSDWYTAQELYEYWLQNKPVSIMYIHDETYKCDTYDIEFEGELYRPIKCIMSSTNEVYDIEVEATHTYLINGLISHNTVNLPSDATVDDVKAVYENCHRNGIKGITIYRDMSRDGQTLQKIDSEKSESAPSVRENVSTERPKVLTGYTQKGETNYGNLYATLNVIDGKPYELFINIGKSGSLAKSLSEALSRTISISLQNGVDINKIIGTLSGIADSEMPWIFEDYKGNIKSCKSIPDMIAQIMKSLNEYAKEIGVVDSKVKNNNEIINIESILEHDKYATDKKKILCPECLKNGNEVMLVHMTGCSSCPSCGWSACSI